MRIVFRTEGNHRQGMGDLMGSIALADECAKGADEVLFLISGGEEAIAAITERGYSYRAAATFEAEEPILRAFRPDVILVNKLKSDPAYLQALKHLVGLVVTVDDNGDGARHAHLRINVLYPVPGAVTDPRYIALRNEFQEAHKREKTIARDVRELLITQGGSDTYGFTPRIIHALEGMRIHPRCTVVLGPAFRHERELAQALKESTLDLTIVRNTRDMAELMCAADLAVTAGGLTMFELLCAGVPSLVVCAERFEIETARRFEEAGAAVNLGFGGDLENERLAQAVDALAGDAPRRAQLSRRGKELVDGRGCERIVELIRHQAVAVGGDR
jgi:spore coat polysaccharide biosynthesis predicted glycosyltransferase SpsG